VIRRILAALDDSPRAPQVLDRAVMLAKAFDAQIRIFHAVAVPQDFPAPAHTTHPDLLPKYLNELATDRLAQLVSHDSATHGITCGVFVAESHNAADAILGEAETFDASMILIGSHRYGGVDRLLGTTTTRVVNRSKRDVLVVHGPFDQR
jgi:nucleotide-binding universal stress UspA family protein